MEHEDKYIHITKGTFWAILIGIPWFYIVISGTSVLITSAPLESPVILWNTIGIVALVTVLLLSIVMVPIGIKYLIGEEGT